MLCITLFHTANWTDFVRGEEEGRRERAERTNKIILKKQSVFSFFFPGTENCKAKYFEDSILLAFWHYYNWPSS